MILRTDKTGGHNRFDQIDKRTLQDFSVLQPEDLGVLCYLLSNSDNWKFNADLVAKKTGWGITKVRSSFKRLLDLGYLYRKKIYGGESNHFIGYAYILKESRFDERQFTDFKLTDNDIYINNNFDDAPFTGF